MYYHEHRIDKPQEECLPPSFFDDWSSQMHEDWIDKTLRETRLLWLGALSVPEAAARSFSNLTPEVIPNLIWALGYNFLLARLFPVRGLKSLLAAGQSSLGVPLMHEATKNGVQFAQAVFDTWNSDRNFDRNLAVIERTFQRLALGATFAATGSILGQLLASPAGHKKDGAPAPFEPAPPAPVTAPQ